MKLNGNLWPNETLRLYGFTGYKYDLKVLKQQTKIEPKWIHFGAGNIFRAFPARLAHELLNKGLEDTGIIIAEGYDYEIIDEAFEKQDNLTLLVTLKSNGTTEKTVIGSMTEALKADPSFNEDFTRLEQVFKSESLQMASFTITEKGYELKNNQGVYLEAVLDDFKEGILRPKSYLGKLVYLLYKRYLFGAYPLALVSMDNYAHNGDKLKASVLEIADAWSKNQLVDSDFVNYLKDPKKISYPWSMIDKITPRPDASVEKMLEEAGFEDMKPKVTAKHTYVAGFVNAEETEYLVIEDHFPNGRPQLDKVGVIFTKRDIVDKVEKMKVATCLNPLHTALAIYGCLLGYEKIHEEMKNPLLVELIKKIGYKEGLPVVVNPGIIDPKAFIDTVIEVRLPNPFMPDTPQRIATDTSQKLAIRFGQTIEAYQKDSKLDPSDLEFIPLVFAGYLRYLLAIDDKGKPFTLSSDPLLDTLKSQMKNIEFKSKIKLADVYGILTNKKIFGVDLVEVGLADKVVDYFNELNAGVGSVNQTLLKYLT